MQAGIGSQRGLAWKRPQERAGVQPLLGAVGSGLSPGCSRLYSVTAWELQGGRQSPSLGNLGHCWAFPWRGSSLSACSSGLHRLFLVSALPSRVLTAALMLVFGRFKKCVFCHLFRGIAKGVKEDDSQD